MKKFLRFLFASDSMTIALIMSVSIYIIYMSFFAIIGLVLGCRNNEQIVKDYIKEHTSIDNPIYVTDTLISKEYKLDTMFVVTKDTVRYVIQKDKVITTFYKQYDTIRIKSKCIPDTVIKTNQILQLKESKSSSDGNMFLFVCLGVIIVCVILYFFR